MKSTKLVVKVTAGSDDPERCAQGFTVASTALASGAQVSLWLTGEAAWFALAGKCEEFDLPYEYLMALLVLECSGQKPAGSRFENGVYNRLVQVKSGDRRKYEAVKQEHLLEASDEAIRNMATSWGPFQLMGYKCVGMDVNVNDIRGERAVFYGAKWIEEEYGRMLRKSHFKDAFHFHNTGRKHPLVGGPRTHDPNYISRGLRYIEYSKSRKPQ